ncbi:30S ribosomal protein S17 [Patescibacteria group bacterium]
MKPLVGKVIRKKIEKMATVEVVRVKVHPVYKKRFKVRKKFSVHDEFKAKQGDQVRIMETRPLSKTKRWKIIEVLKKPK